MKSTRHQIFNRKIMIHLIVLFLLICYLPNIKSQPAQQNISVYKDTVIGGTTYKSYSNKTLFSGAQSKIVRVIVEFNVEPEVIKVINKKSNYLNSKKSISNEDLFQRFENDLVALCNIGVTLSRIDTNTGNISQVQETLSKPVFKNKYSKVFVGQTIEIDTLLIDQINELPYVKRIHPVRKYSINLEESVTQIHADSVQKVTGNKGDSVRIGIIDTGIDYNHPDLGGGYGPGHKVIGGYDFYNHDEDPMDDNEHGTHVAGIIAADGKLTGVAPKALLYALKVLDHQGSGWNYDLISAIEYTVDPNNDGIYNDKLDIVNMSLGLDRFNTDTALESAVQNASEMGITFCIAAGNSRHMKAKTISTPATAPLAIAVAAVDKLNNIAFYSSCGPTPNSLLLKPEISAPGDAINSTVLNGKYRKLSGTSMATPHIAGVCALLKRLHPEWGPSEIKAALVLTAHKINTDRIIQGAGVVDAWRASQLRVLVGKSIYNFGLDSLKGNEIWIQTDTLSISNLLDTVLNCSLHLGDSVQGVKITFSDNNFTLSPYETKKILLTIEVNNKDLPIIEITNSEMFSGSLKLKAENDDYTILWSFNRGVYIHILDNEQLSDFFLLNNKNSYLSSDHSSQVAKDIFIAAGNYCYVARKYRKILAWSTYLNLPYYYFIGQIDLTRNTTLRFETDKAKNKIIFATKDENNDPSVTNLAKSRSVLVGIGDSILIHLVHFNDYNYTEMSINTANYAGGGSQNMLRLENLLTARGNLEKWRIFDTICIVDLPEGFNIIAGETRRRLNNFSLCFNKTSVYNGLSSNITLTNNSLDYNKVFFGFDKSKTVFSWIEEPCWRGIRQEKTGYFEDKLTPMKEVKVYMPSFKESTNSVDINFSINFDQSGYFAPVTCIDNKFIFGTGKTPASYFYEPADTMISPSNPQITVINPANNNTEDQVYILFKNQGPLGENFNSGSFPLKINLYNEQGELIKTKDSWGIITDTIQDETPLYDMVIDGSGNLYGKSSTVRAKIKFELNSLNPNPPILSSLRLEDNKRKITSVFDKNDTVVITFSLTDRDFGNTQFLNYNSVESDSTSIKIRKQGTDNWTVLKCDTLGENPRVGLVYRAYFNDPQADSAYYDLKIKGYGKTGNYLEETINPAMFIRNIQRPVANDDSYEFFYNRKFRTKKSILFNDKNPYGDALKMGIKIIDSTLHGKIVLNDDGTVNYTPDLDYFGTDYFTYYAINEKYYSNPADVTFKVKYTGFYNQEIKGENGIVEIFPNPANSKVTIRLNTLINDKVEISIYDISGKLVRHFACESSNSYIWDLNDEKDNRVTSGVYIIKVKSSNVNETQRLIIN